MLAAQADDMLTSGPFLLIDATNRSVGRAADAAAVTHALATGTATTWAALPRRGVCAIDIDLPETFAALVADQLTGWCRVRGLWHTVRQSGRPGHLHVWVLAQAHAEGLEHVCGQLRAELRLSATQLDYRAGTYIRPLAAPHRSGDPAPASLTDAQVAELGTLLAHTAPPRRRRQDKTTRQPVTGTPRRRRLRRHTPDAAPGQPRALVSGDDSRSGIEFALTRDAYNAGRTADEAWRIVEARHGHSAERGRAWWTSYMWERIVPALPPTDARVDPSRSVRAIAARLALLPDLDTRSAHSLDAVLWVLGELVDAPQSPASQRDIEGRTGLSRRTVATALTRAREAGIITRTRTGRPDDADQWTWGDLAGVITPPVLTPPSSHWLHSHPRGSATALARHLLDLSPHPQLPAVLPLVSADPPTPLDSPAWPRITAERDRWHDSIRTSRDEYTHARIAASQSRRRHPAPTPATRPHPHTRTNLIPYPCPTQSHHPSRATERSEGGSPYSHTAPPPPPRQAVVPPPGAVS